MKSQTVWPIMPYNSSKNRSVEPLGPSCKKGAYRSQEEAEDIIAHIHETRHAKALHTYQCPTCGLWHLSSKAGH